MVFWPTLTYIYRQPSHPSFNHACLIHRIRSLQDFKRARAAHSGAVFQDEFNEAQPVAYNASVRLMAFAGQVAGRRIQEEETLLLSVLKGSGTSSGTPLSRSAKVNWASSLDKKLNMLRQLYTFRFLPNLFASHATFILLVDEELLLGGAKIFTRDCRFEDDAGLATRLPMPSERCGTLAARTMSK